jgi:uncharacterized protein involved in outer membrane biogenesis
LPGTRIAEHGQPQRNDNGSMTQTSRARLRKAWPLAVIAVLLVAGGVCEWRGWPFLAGPLQHSLAKRLQRPVELGDEFQLRLLGSIRLDTDALRIGEPNGLPAGSPLGGNLVDARDAHLQIPYSTVFGLMRSRHDVPLRIASLRFGRLDAAFKRQADGRANWSTASPDKTSAHSFQMPQFDELVVRNGHVRFEDAVSKTLLEARISTREGEGRTAAGEQAAGLVVEGRGEHDNRPFELRVTSTGVLPLVSRDSAAAVPVTVRLAAGDAKFGFDGTGTDLLSLRALDGDAVLSGSSLARVGDQLGITLPTTEPFTLHGRLGKSGDLWSLKKIALDVGDSRLGGEFSFDRRSAPPVLRGELNGKRMVLADLLPAFGAPRPGSGNPKIPAGHMVPQREFDIPSLHAMNADVKLRLQRAELGTLFREPLQPLQGDLTLRGGVLTIDNFMARAAGGEVKGAMGLDASSRTKALWSADLRWAGIELDQWLRPRNKTSQVSKPSGENPGYITGKLGGHAKLNAQGNSTAKMLASIDGTVQAWVREGTVSHLIVEAAGLDLAQGLGLLFVGDDPLPLNCAVLKADAKNGTLTPEVAILDTRDSTLFVSGSVSLADEKLALTLTSKPKDMSPASLRAPVKIAGTFADPEVQIGKSAIGLRLLASVALAAVNPLAALIPLFDPGDKEAAGGCRRMLGQLRDANGPAGSPDSKAPKPADAAMDGKVSKGAGGK